MQIIDLTLDDEDSSESDLECVGDGINFANAKLQRDSELLYVLNTPFAGKVSIDNRDSALKVASSEYTNDWCDRLVFWSDASIRNFAGENQSAGIAVVWRTRHGSHAWQNKTYTLRGYFNIDETEFFGIAEAMRLAAAMMKASDGRGQGTKVVIYADNQACLRWVRDFDNVGPTRQYLITRQRELAILKKRGKALVEMGVDLELRWVPAHAGVGGNRMADTLAGRASKYGGSVFGGLRFDQLEPVADAYLQDISRSAPPTRLARKLARTPPRTAMHEPPSSFHMRLRSANRAANVGLRRSLPELTKSQNKALNRSARLASKRMERYQKMLSMQANETVTPGTKSTARRSPLPIPRALTRTITIDGVTKKLVKRPPPPLLTPRKVIIEEDPEELPSQQEIEPQRKRRTWSRLKVFLNLD